MPPTDVRKRSGAIVPFDQSKITNAILKSFNATKEGGASDAQNVSDRVVKEIDNRFPKGETIGIESIQDVVEKELMASGFLETAKAYILYREERASLRERAKEIPETVSKISEESKKYFQNTLGEFIYYRTYSRWIESENRRETWIETIDRYVNFMKENLGAKLSEAEYGEVRLAILNQEVLPSMRLVWGSGPAARATNAVGYNCSFVAPTKLRDFGEIMYLSMCGCGVGFSVEEQVIQQLPQIKKQTGEKLTAHVVGDSKEGWADAFVTGLETWYSGKDIDFDFSQVRPQGSRLMTMGGKSSGPDPLRDALQFAKGKIFSRQGRRLKPIDAHDIICKIGEVVVMGGVRRTALISLSDLDDQEMRMAKFGQFYNTEPQRMMANNSTIYNEKPSAAQFLDEWVALAKSGSGERGIFNRGGLKYQMPERRYKMMGNLLETAGTNPCGEITLRSKEFCNLSEIVARENDTEETLLKKARIASILGTYQSTLTNFKYLSEEWKKNCEEEALLGVSITGQWDCPAVRHPEVMMRLRDEAIKVNQEYAKRFGVNPSASVTCVKPSGNGSQLLNSSSGTHPRHSEYYIRRVRIASTDALFKMMRDQKVPYYPEVGQTYENATTYVLEFPVKAPKGSVYKNDLTAIDQLEYWKMVKQNFTEHNPSVTISVGDEEWIAVADWVYKNWDIIGGLSFLPREDHVYQLAPYEAISEARYNEMIATYPEINFSQILLYEAQDETQGSKELACAGGTCEIK